MAVVSNNTFDNKIEQGIPNNFFSFGVQSNDSIFSPAASFNGKAVGSLSDVKVQVITPNNTATIDSINQSSGGNSADYVAFQTCQTSIFGDNISNNTVNTENNRNAKTGSFDGYC